MIAPSVKPRRARLSLGREEARTLRIALTDWLAWEPECLGSDRYPDEQPRHERYIRSVLAKLSKATRYVAGER